MLWRDLDRAPHPGQKVGRRLSTVTVKACSRRSTLTTFMPAAGDHVIDVFIAPCCRIPSQGASPPASSGASHPASLAPRVNQTRDKLESVRGLIQVYREWYSKYKECADPIMAKRYSFATASDAINMNQMEVNMTCGGLADKQQEAEGKISTRIRNLSAYDSFSLMSSVEKASEKNSQRHSCYEYIAKESLRVAGHELWAVGVNSAMDIVHHHNTGVT